MSQFKDKKIDMKELMNEICKQVKGLTQQVFLTVWEAFRKFTFQQLELDRTIVILDSFYLQLIKENQIKIIKLMPTSTLLAQFSLNYRSDDNDLSNMGSLVSVTKGNLFKYIESKDRESLEITKQNAYFIYTFSFKYIKNIIKKHKSVNLQLDFLGSIAIYERTFIHQPELKNVNNEKIKVKQLIEKESVQNFSDLKRQSLLIKSKQNLLEKTKSNLMNSSSFSSLKVNDQSYFQTSQQFRRKLSPQYSNELIKKRPLFHDMIDQNKSQNVRIINDLLGAGIDPLTYDYNHSKMVENSSELFYHKFEKPQKAKTRLPGLIDKFSRTIGAQLTGAKVSTSSSIRIGSNYSPSVKNFYIDLSVKQIMRVPQQITIKLTEKSKISPANQQQQYNLILGQSKVQNYELQKKVDLRKKMFQRYQQYCTKQIPNQCVAPLSRQVLKNIADKIKEIVKSLGRVQGKQIFDKLINEVNRFYYISGKKAIVDYILKDESQKNRTGITIIFKPAHNWGVVQPGQFFPEIRKQNTIRKRIILQSQFLIYPDLILQIVKHNQMVDKLSPFDIELPKNVRPMNVLYHLKRHSNNFTQIMKFLNEKWVKGAVQIITRNKNWKKQNVRNFNIFMNNVHTLMSNKLKDLVSKTLKVFTKVNKMFDYDNPPPYPKPVLYLHLGEQNRKIIFMDDLNNIYRKQVNQVHRTLFKSLSQILTPECYIKQGQEKFLWSVDPNDENLIRFNEQTEKIIEKNYEQTQKVKEEMKRFQKIFRYKDELIVWTKTNFQSKQLDIKLKQLKSFQTQIEQIPFYRKTLVAVIDCHDLKKKLHYEIKLMRYYLFECIENLVKKVDQSITDRIKILSEQISKEIKTTADYVELSRLIQSIKQKQLIEISQQISNNQKLLMKLFSIENCFVSHDVLKEIYNMKKSLKNLQDKVVLNQDRIMKERSQLQKTLKQRISNFQTLTVTQLREINLKIDSFEVRKLYTEYLVYLTDFRQRSEKNMKQMLILNHEEDDLKWASTTFSSAIQLQNLISPNFQLWRLVEFYDQNVRQWKHLQLCNFDIEKTESRMVEIDTGISKIINKLKNFSSLKIAHELQNDVKQVLNRQLPIIKIFSHPGLKERHWHLFSKKLTIPGYDLKQITYGRIKILYDYEKNLKVLSSISNQAAKQFEIENEKNQMSVYWYSLNCDIRTDSMDQQMVFIQEDFLNIQIACVEDHLMRTLLIKNSPFSKALNQMLTDWQNYLLTVKNILVGFKNAQQGFMAIKEIFKIEDISKYLPIQNTEFESIQNIWKSVIKKVLQQPKISQLFKSQKIIEILDEITKKSLHIKSSLPIFLHSKRVQFPRFFFVNDSDLIELFSYLNKGNQKQALYKIAQNCFNGLVTIQKFDKGYRMRSSIDYLDVTVQKQSNSKKNKIRVIQDAPILLKMSKQKIKSEIKAILGTQNITDNESALSKYTVTSLLAAQHITFSQRLIQLKQDNDNTSEKNWKQLQKYSKQMLDFIETKQRQVNMNEVRKTDFIVFRKLCYRQIFNFLLRRNDGVIDSFQIETIPMLNYKNNDENSLVLNIYSLSIDYDYEYIGQDVLGLQMYGPLSYKIIYQMLQSINNGDITLLNTNDSRMATRMLSQMAGKFYKQVDFVSYLSSNTNGIYEILAGLVSSDVWINLNMDDEALLRLASQNLSLISEIIEQKRAKIKQNSDYLLIKQNQIAIQKGNGVFFYVNPRVQIQLPERLFSSCRTLTNLGSQNLQLLLMQFMLSNEVFVNWQSMSVIKMVIEIMRNIHPQSKINISQILSGFNSILSDVEQGENPKTKKIIVCKMLQKIFFHQIEQKNIRNFLKLHQKQVQPILHLQKQNNTQISPLSLGFQKFFNSKIQSLQLQSKFYDKVIVYGTYGHKTILIQTYLQKLHFSIEESQQITINTSFISDSETQNIPSINSLIQKTLKSYQKASRMSNYQRINPIIFDGLVNDQRLKIILESLENYKKKKPQKQISCFIECPQISTLSPQYITSIGKIFMNNYQLSDRGLFQQWAQKLTLKSQQIEYVKSLGIYLQGIVDLVLKNKHILANLNKDYPARYIMVKSFLKFYEIYLMNLNTKQVQALPQFDVENYILNSFVFASYWSFGVGFAVDQSRRTLEVYLKETFGCQYDIPHSIEDHLLNQENQWVAWDNLKQEFAPQKQSDAPLCSLWVPTIENTKFYTIIIKLLEKDLPLILLGFRSGKSTLLREIPNFQISYTTFLIDCNIKTNAFRVGKLIRQRVVYGDEKKHLILVDDLHLPLKNKESKINELLLQIVKTSSIPTFSYFGSINQKLKKSNLLLSANLNQQSNFLNEHSMSRVLSKFQPLNLRRIDQRQMQCIFKPYLSYFFNHNEFESQQLRLEGVIMLVLVKIFDCQKFLRLTGKEFTVDVCDIRKIVDSICRINPQQFKDKFQILSYLFYEANTLLSGKIQFSFLDVNRTHSQLQSYLQFRKALQAQHTKFCNPEKNTKQFDNLLLSYIYKDVPYYDISLPLDKNEMKNKMRNHLKIKSFDHPFVMTTELVNTIQKIIHLLQATPSHIIFVSPKRTGARSLINIVSKLKNLNYIQLGTSYNAEQFIQQVIKILKTGGKIDECVCCLPNDKQKQQQFLSIVNSFISSAQFYQSLSQIQLQQIIKSFNSEKKVLKKDIKKSEIIKKIKQKLNSIFHFIVCIQENKLNEIIQTYPNMLRDSFIYMHEPWCEQSTVQIFSQIFQTQKDQTKKVTKMFQTVYEAIRNDKNEESCALLTPKSIEMNIISLMEIYNSFQKYFQKLQKSNSQSFNVWQKKITSNQTKLQQLIIEKDEFEQLNKNRFQQIQDLKQSIEQKKEKLKVKRLEFKQIEQIYNNKKDKVLTQKSKLYIKSDQLGQVINAQVERQFLAIRSQKLKVTGCQQNSLLQQLIQHYEIIHGKQQLLVDDFKELFETIRKQGFESLMEYCQHVGILQQQLQLLSHPIQKAFLNILITLWPNITHYQTQHLQFKTLQDEYKQQQQQYFKTQSQIRSIEDEMEQTKQQIQQLTERNSKLLDAHQQIIAKISHLESLMDIFKKLKSTVENKNVSIPKDQMEDSLSNQQLFGLKILLTVCLKQGISNCQCKLFKTIKKALSIAGYQVSQKSILSLLPIQQRIQIQYCLNDNSFQSILNYLIIELSPVYCTVIDYQKDIQTYLRRWSQKQINYLPSNSSVQQFKSLIMVPGYLIIYNPHDQLINQIKLVLSYPRDRALYTQFNGQINEFTFHQQTKIIFLFSSKQAINPKVTNYSPWICEINHYFYSQKIVQNFLYRLTSNRDCEQLASILIEKQKQLDSLGQRMHGLVIKMKKDNLNPQQIQQRIAQVNSRKISIEKDLRNFKSELKQIFNHKPQLNKHIQLIVSFYNTYQIRLNELLQLVKDVYLTKQKYFHRALEQVSSLVQLFIKKREKSSETKIQKLSKQKQKKKTFQTTLKKKSYVQKKPTIQQMKSLYETQINKVNLAMLSQFTHILSKQHYILRTDEPNILKKCVLASTKKQNLPLIQRKISQINSITFMPNLWILTEVKTAVDWQQLYPLVKSIKEKKLSIKLLILAPSDIHVPIYVRDIKEFNLTSFLMFLVKIIYAEQDQILLQKGIQLFYQHFVEKNSLSRFQKLAILEYELLDSKKVTMRYLK